MSTVARHVGGNNSQRPWQFFPALRPCGHQAFTIRSFNIKLEEAACEITGRNDSVK